MKYESKKEETHTIEFTPEDILTLLKNEAIKKAGFDPDKFQSRSLVVNTEPVKNIKLMKNIPIVTIVITNPESLEPVQV